MGNRHESAAYRELGGMLRELREKAGLSATQLAHKLGWSTTTLSRMENGRRPSTTTDVIQYAVMCGAKFPDLRPLVAFTRMAETQQGYYLSDKRIDGSLQSLIFHESTAEHSIVYEPLAIHGLLQTPEYARAHIAAVEIGIDEEWLASVVRTRMERRQILYQANPAKFTFFIHERALKLRVGDDRVMHEQFLHLVFTAASDNIVVRIVPSHAGVFGDAFRLMEFPEHRPVVYLDNLVFGGLVLDEPEYVNSYYKIVPTLDDAALDEGQSLQFAADLAYAYERGSQRHGADVAQEQLQPWVRDGLCGGGMEEEQPQPRRGNRLRGGGVAEPPTPIYE